MVRRYNAEGNRRTATPELLRCNAKVIRRLVRWIGSIDPDVDNGSVIRWTVLGQSKASLSKHH